MNVYDFDKTIYRDDSSMDFYFFTLKRNPKVLSHLPSLTGALILWGVGRYDKTGFKEKMYSYLSEVEDIDAHLEEFWNAHEYKIKEFYKKNQQKSDVVISASPEFLLRPICDRLGIKYLLASRVNKRNGHYTGENCWGEEKVKRFYQKFGKDARIDKFYSDSLSDTPLALLARESYLVKGDEILPWK